MNRIDHETHDDISHVALLERRESAGQDVSTTGLGACEGNRPERSRLTDAVRYTNADAAAQRTVPLREEKMPDGM